METQIIILGGGCFWCVEAVYQGMKGINAVVPGYAGGFTEDPTYKEVCKGKTGHAEVVQVEYNHEEISLEKILDVFFAAHDPTTLNLQGSDVGTEYRSIILYTSSEQKQIIEKILTDKAQEFKDPLVTEVEKLTRFYEAEEYHHNYFAKHPDAGYCKVVIAPKLEKIERLVKDS